MAEEEDVNALFESDEEEPQFRELDPEPASPQDTRENSPGVAPR